MSTNTVVHTSAITLTRRGRIVVTAFFLAVVACAMIFIGGRAAASFETGSTEQVRYVEVTSGDTLYSIAGEYAEDGHVRDLVQRIQDLNSMPSANIHEGQRIAIPID